MQKKEKIKNPLPFIFTASEWKVILLRDFNTSSYSKELFSRIAEELKKSESTVKNQYNNAKRKYNKFKEQLKTFNEFEESDIRKVDLKNLFRRPSWFD